MIAKPRAQGPAPPATLLEDTLNDLAGRLAARQPKPAGQALTRTSLQTDHSLGHTKNLFTMTNNAGFRDSRICFFPTTSAH